MKVNFGHTITEDGHAHTTDARNVLIFGADMVFSVHATNKANHIYLMGTGLTQDIIFVVDCEQISGVKAIYDMHRYLITKHNINS